ncbi:hypothetical protein FXO38_22763 [Capsicum annuum]|nr:hypothetical protein FXO38_22763 [Capsicum annuum]
MRRIIIRGLKPEYIPFVTSIQGWAQQPSLEEFENLLLSQELLAKQLAGEFVKEREGNALVANKKNVRGKTRDMSHSPFFGGSRSPGKKEEFCDNYGKSPLRCYRCGKLGRIRRYCRAHTKKFVEEKEGWWEGTDKKQEDIEDVQTGQVLAAIREIKEADPEIGNTSLNVKDVEVDSEETVSGNQYVSDDIIGESIKEDIVKVEVSDQSYQDGEIYNMIAELEIESSGGSYYNAKASRKINDQIVIKSIEEDGIDENSVYHGVVSEGACSKILITGVPNISIKDVSPNSTTVRKLRGRGILKIEQGYISRGSQKQQRNSTKLTCYNDENFVNKYSCFFAGSITDGKPLSHQEGKGIEKILLRSSSRHAQKIRLSSSATSLG